MRSFSQVIVLLFALFAFALAQDSVSSYDATVYVTSTVYRVNTVTMSGTPTGSAANSTVTIPATVASVASYYPAGKGTTAAPTGSGSPTTAAPSQFTGAASNLKVNAFVAAIAAGVGYLAL